MPSWQNHLRRWADAGLLDQDTVARIENFEASQPSPARSAPAPVSDAAGLRWPVVVALAFGGVLLGAGVLLFVNAHWEELGPGARLALVLAALGGFHLGGSFTAVSFPGLSATLHALGTVALGGAIAMTGQIFHIEEHWPNAILLWTLGAWAGVWLLRSWPQVAAAALLTPGWAASEVSESLPAWTLVVTTSFLLLSFTYMSAARAEGNRTWRTCLNGIGSVSLLLFAILVPLARESHSHIGGLRLLMPVAVAVGLGYLLRRELWWPNAAAAVWTVLYAIFTDTRQELATYAWAAIGAIGLVAWGLHDRRVERINLGMAGFALTVLFFYFSNVMSALDRSFALILLGLLFLGGGWGMEKLRRRLVAQVREGSAV